MSHWCAFHMHESLWLEMDRPHGLAKTSSSWQKCLYRFLTPEFLLVQKCERSSCHFPRCSFCHEVTDQIFLNCSMRVGWIQDTSDGVCEGMIILFLFQTDTGAYSFTVSLNLECISYDGWYPMSKTLLFSLWMDLILILELNSNSQVSTCEKTSWELSLQFIF